MLTCARAPRARRVRFSVAQLRRLSEPSTEATGIADTISDESLGISSRQN